MEAKVVTQWQDDGNAYLVLGVEEGETKESFDLVDGQKKPNPLIQKVVTEYIGSMPRTKEFEALTDEEKRDALIAACRAVRDATQIPKNEKVELFGMANSVTL